MIILRDCFYVPNFKRNLISVACLFKDSYVTPENISVANFPLLDVSSEVSAGSGNKFVDVLPGVATKKRLSLCGDVLLSRAQKKISSIEAELKKIEREKLERKKTEYVEKMKNKIALIHKDVEKKRTVIEAKKDENVLKAEEMAAKYHVTGTAPKKLLGCF
ncbi:hypothetical protein UlMin_035210 [Ulmus minor]